jgi:hypothetical protein
MKINILFLIIISLAITACRDKKTEKSGNLKNIIRAASNDGKTVASRVLRTQTGKTIVINESHPDGFSISRVEMIPADFKDNRTILMNSIDPVLRAELTDLDKNGFDEVFIFTRSAGSGSAGVIFGFASDKDERLVKIEIPADTEIEDQQRGIPDGYMGHDKYYFENGMVVREFPVYKNSDANVNPTGGKKRVYYTYKNYKLEFLKVVLAN